MYFIVPDHKPNTNIIANYEHYQSMYEGFLRSTSLIKQLADSNPIIPDLDVSNQKNVDGMMHFMKKVHELATPKQWRDGVQLSKQTLMNMCGNYFAPSGLGAELRACLIKVKSGYRKKGEADTYTLSQRHLLGIASAVAAGTAWKQREAMMEMEAAELKLREMDKLNSALNKGPDQDPHIKELITW